MYDELAAEGRGAPREPSLRLVQGGQLWLRCVFMGRMSIAVGKTAGCRQQMRRLPLRCRKIATAPIRRHQFLQQVLPRDRRATLRMQAPAKNERAFRSGALSLRTSSHTGATRRDGSAGALLALWPQAAQRRGGRWVVVLHEETAFLAVRGPATTHRKAHEAWQRRGEGRQRRSGEDTTPQQYLAAERSRSPAAAPAEPPRSKHGVVRVLVWACAPAGYSCRRRRETTGEEGSWTISALG